MNVAEEVMHSIAATLVRELTHIHALGWSRDALVMLGDSTIESWFNAKHKDKRCTCTYLSLEIRRVAALRTLVRLPLWL